MSVVSQVYWCNASSLCSGTGRTFWKRRKESPYVRSSLAGNRVKTSQRCISSWEKQLQCSSSSSSQIASQVGLKWSHFYLQLFSATAL